MHLCSLRPLLVAAALLAGAPLASAPERPSPGSPDRASLGALGTAFGALGGRLEAQAPPPMQKVERRFAAAPDISVRIYGEFTSLRVVGWEHDSVAVTGVITKGTRFEASVGNAVGPARGAKMFVEGAAEGNLGQGRLEMRVPVRARVWAKSGSADIEVTGVAGGVDVNIVGGSVRVSDHLRELNVESMDGDVRISGGADWLRVKTATGAIELRGGSQDAGLSSVSGTIRIDTGRYERARFETVTGDIIYAGDVVRGSTLDFNTHSGLIELRFPPKSSMEFHGLTVTGAIDNTFSQRRPISGREGRGMELAFEHALGESRVIARSFKGNIVLRQR